MSRQPLSSLVRIALEYLAFLVFTLFAVFPFGLTAARLFPSKSRSVLANSTSVDVAAWSWRMALLALAVALLGVALASVLGYFFSRFQGRSRSAVLDLSPLPQILPALLLLAPLAVALWWLGLGWAGLWVGLIALAIALPFCSWQLKRSYDAISPAAEEAAALDGCTTWQKYVAILWPAAAPALAWTAFVSFVSAWNVGVVAALILGDRVSSLFPQSWRSFRMNPSEQWALCVTAGFALALLIACSLWLLPRQDEAGATPSNS